MTHIQPFQDLSAASFLSPTGQCKPFDEAADGYCRAEGIACVFLKKLSDAVADGNPVLACIASTAVHQNQNCTPLFVPNSPSLSQLFGHVMQEAKVTARDISLVEAHGTGTPVGDPAEYESIRLALGGPIREKSLPIGSVKGHIGHTEGASGVIALIKIITLMRGGFLPKQASFSSMSHHIDVRPGDMMEVVTSLRPWNDERKIALLNNYGASGSNASMVVTQSPFSGTGLASAPIRRVDDSSNTHRFPFWIAGLEARNITSYSAKLAEFLRATCPEEATLADVSFNANRQSNRDLAKGLIFACRSIADLKEKLQEAETNNSTEAVTVKPERPVILCFGGQVSTCVGLDRKLYDSIGILRQHLDQCDNIIKSLGLDSIYPDIFMQEPVRDTVKLQTMLFAMQYASAKAWMDCGLETKVAAVVGHSFGEITALCVAGVLSLEDAVKLITSRARLVRDVWGADPGAMMAVEADEALVHELLTDANKLNRMLDDTDRRNRLLQRATELHTRRFHQGH
jgi:acyl transferase domain-containing protein